MAVTLRKAIFVITCLAVGMTCQTKQSKFVFAGNTQARKIAGSAPYKHYFNEKYCYSVDYPSYLVPGPEPDAQDGRKFTSKDKPLTMSVWGHYSNWMSGDEMTIDEEKDWTLKNLAGDQLPAPKVTYKAQGKNWFVISGLSRDNTFYQRTIRTKDSFVTVLIIYPTAKKLEYDAMVQHVASSLKG
jgi:hypothetical protein